MIEKWNNRDNILYCHLKSMKSWVDRKYWVFCSFLNEHFFSQLKRGISVGFYAIV